MQTTRIAELRSGLFRSECEAQPLGALCATRVFKFHRFILISNHVPYDFSALGDRWLIYPILSYPRSPLLLLLLHLDSTISSYCATSVLLKSTGGLL